MDTAAYRNVRRIPPWVDFVIAAVTFYRRYAVWPTQLATIRFVDPLSEVLV